MSDLFSPLTLGARTLRNRIAFTATVSLMGERGCVTPKLVDFHRERAIGGAAMIVTEGMVVHPSSVIHGSALQLFTPAIEDSLKQLASAVEAHDCRIIGQLWHIGRQNLLNPVDAAVGVSSQPDALSWVVPHVLEPDEISEIVEAFAAGARRLKDCGFSGAELHGAHGYLITQFLSPWSNTRNDDYGGDLQRRMRFLNRIIERTRELCGRDFILGLKMPADEGVRGGIDIDEAERIAMALQDKAGLNYIAFSQGNFSPSLEDHVPDMYYAPGPFLDFHRRLKSKLTRMPVMAVGRIAGPDAAARVIKDRIADIVGLSRPLISDPSFPVKAAQGRAKDIRPCIYCNVCWGETALGKELACIHNPQLGRPGEATWTPPAAQSSKRVVVVGAGVAGLEAAWVAAARGHDVTVFSRSQAAGGSARLEAMLPGRSEVARVYEYQLDRAKEHGVQLRLGETATIETIAGLNPDSLILATGAKMRAPFDGAIPAVSVRDYVAGARDEVSAGTAVLFDFDHTAATYAAADLLAARFAKLVLVTTRPLIARAVPVASAIGVLRRLHARHADIVVSSAIAGYADGVVTLVNVFNGVTRDVPDVAALVYSTPRVANDALAHEARARGISCRLIGDAYAPRTMIAAIHEGHHAAISL